MATKIYLGNPPEHVVEWIKSHTQPVQHEETWYKYAGDTEWRTVMLTGEIALVDDIGEPTGQIDNPYDIVAIEIGTGTQVNPVTSIGYQAFYGCAGLMSVTIPDSITSIGQNAFCYCSGLTAFVVGGHNPSYKSVSGLLLTKDSKTLVAVPGGLTSVTIPDSVTSIEGYAFMGCTSLTNVTIPDNVTSIGNYAFGGCSGLTSVTIPDSVTSIGYDTFYNCSGLTSVTIPDSVTSIGNQAFEGCNGLTSITINCFDVSTTKSLITDSYIFGDAFYDPDTGEPFEKTFLVTCTNGSFNVTFGTDYSITFTDL